MNILRKIGKCYKSVAELFERAEPYMPGIKNKDILLTKKIIVFTREIPVERLCNEVIVIKPEYRK